MRAGLTFPRPAPRSPRRDIRSPLNAIDQAPSCAAALVLVASAASAEDLTFRFENRSSYTIVELYASPSNVDDWEEDILGSDVLEAGAAANVTIADDRRACEYDLRIVFEDGDVVEDTTDLCETENYTVTD